ncbi:hypothetical protein [Actinophytocola sp. NPDC049390]|uniref:hypothetical protein n=1 Tax=Actinophytocola sp. NPDC049390 TaxID=3363894 RepID=UPI0037B0BD83
MTDRRLSEATVNAITDLGMSSSVRYDDDVSPALAAAGIPEVPFSEVMEWAGAGFMPGAREQITLSLRALDLADAQIVDRVIRFATRLMGVYLASNDADRAKIVRLRNALADDGYDMNMEDKSVGGFSIDKRGIAQMMREMQLEFDKHPISVPLNTDPTVVSPTSTTIYHGPVIHGNANGAQLAWGNQAVNQTQHVQTEQVAPGFEVIAQALAKTLEGLHSVGLDTDDQEDAEAAAKEALAEVTQAEPDRGKLRRALNSLKGVLAPVATGLMTGLGEGAQEWANTAIKQLGVPF